MAWHVQYVRSSCLIFFFFCTACTCGPFWYECKVASGLYRSHTLYHFLCSHDECLRAVSQFSLFQQLLRFPQTLLQSAARMWCKSFFLQDIPALYHKWVSLIWGIHLAVIFGGHFPAALLDISGFILCSGSDSHLSPVSLIFSQCITSGCCIARMSIWPNFN